MQGLASTFIFTLFVSISAWAVPYTPIVQMSPGAMCNSEDPDWKEYRYPEKIDYRKRKVSSRLKVWLYERYGIPRNCRSYYTIDHIVPLSLGGNNRVENLWPEHKSIKATRQNLEFELYQLLRDGRISQRDAVNTVLRAKFRPKLPKNFVPSPNCPN